MQLDLQRVSTRGTRGRGSHTGFVGHTYRLRHLEHIAISRREIENLPPLTTPLNPRLHLSPARPYPNTRSSVPLLRSANHSPTDR